MNKLKINRPSIQSGSTRKISSGALQLYKSTLTYTLDKIAENYYTPDDRFYEVDVQAMTLLKAPLHIIVNFEPHYSKYNKGNKYLPSLTLVLDYNTDVELTEKIYDDIMLTLSHFGMSGLYNNTGKQIIVNINQESKRP